MPRPRLLHLVREVYRGKVFWYVRLGHGGRGRRIRIRAVYGTPEFDAQCDAAFAGKVVEAVSKTEPGSLQDLWDLYRKSSAWKSLKNATQRQRANIMTHVLAENGSKPFAKIRAEHIADGRERRAATPSQANNFLNTMRALFAWAVEAKLTSTNPASEVKTLRRPKTEGFLAWDMADVEKFRAHWPIGTRERLALEILLTTGLRRGDAAQLGKQHFRRVALSDDDGNTVIRDEIEMRPQKSEGKTNVVLTIPVAPELSVAMEATKTGDLTLIATASGKGMVKEGFGNWFGESARAAGIAKNCHGLRKLAATVVAENGATEMQMMALFGWTDPAMARIYTKKANSRRLARAGARLLIVSKT